MNILISSENFYRNRPNSSKVKPIWSHVHIVWHYNKDSISSGFYISCDFFRFKSLISLSFNRNVFKLGRLDFEHSTKGVTKPFFPLILFLFEKNEAKVDEKNTILRNLLFFENFQILDVCNSKKLKIGLYYAFCLSTKSL